MILKNNSEQYTENFIKCNFVVWKFHCRYIYLEVPGTEMEVKKFFSIIQVYLLLTFIFYPRIYGNERIHYLKSNK